MIIIPEGTLALDNEGRRLESIQADILKDVPSLPLDCCLVGEVYSLQPDGAQFEPPIQLVIAYDSNDLDNGTMERDLFVACCNGADTEWLSLESEFNIEDRSFTANIEHFTMFAILGFQNPTEWTGPPGNSYDDIPQGSTPANGESTQPIEEQSIETQTQPTSPPSAQETTKGTDWYVLGPVIGVSVFAIIFFPARYMRKKKAGLHGN
jgi:hypothetical protein